MLEGDVAQQAITQGLQVTEHAAKLAANGFQKFAALLLALVQSHRQTHGKKALSNFIMSTNEPQEYLMSKRQARKFKSLADDKGIKVIPTRDKTNKDNKLYNVIARGEDAKCLNPILEKMGYAVPTQEKDGEVKNAHARAGQEKKSPSRGNTLTQLPDRKPHRERTNMKNTDGKMPVRERVDAKKVASAKTKSGQSKSRGIRAPRKSKAK